MHIGSHLAFNTDASRTALRDYRRPLLVILAGLAHVVSVNVGQDVRRTFA